jgi:hypothetical protein
MRGNILVAVFIAALFFNIQSWALPASDFFSRREAVLNHFGIQEKSFQDDLARLSNQQSKLGVNALLPTLDPAHVFPHFALFKEQSSEVLEAYQDLDSFNQEDFEVPLSLQTRTAPILQNFRPTSAQPLNGMRIALDPGHMEMPSGHIPPENGSPMAKAICSMKGY